MQTGEVIEGTFLSKEGTLVVADFGETQEFEFLPWSDLINADADYEGHISANGVAPTVEPSSLELAAPLNDINFPYDDFLGLIASGDPPNWLLASHGLQLEPTEPDLLAAPQNLLPRASKESNVTMGLPNTSRRTVGRIAGKEACIKRRVRPAKHKCTTCGDTFTSKHNLIHHTNYHSGYKPHHCDVCDRSFTTPSDLKRHRKSKTCQQKRS